jgi:hypothetical protein
MEFYRLFYPYRLKRDIINKGEYLLKSSCSDFKSCDKLLFDIHNTRNNCNDLFSKYHTDNLDDKGNILTDSLCSNLKEKENSINTQIDSYLKRKAGRLNQERQIINQERQIINQERQIINQERQIINQERQINKINIKYNNIIILLYFI